VYNAGSPTRSKLIVSGIVVIMYAYQFQYQTLMHFVYLTGKFPVIIRINFHLGLSIPPHSRQINHRFNEHSKTKQTFYYIK